MMLRLRLRETVRAPVVAEFARIRRTKTRILANSATTGLRPGITLLEVVIALAIFLFSVTAIWQLVVFGGDRALDVKYNAKASILCQRELAKRTSGVEPLTSSTVTSLPDEESWQCEVEVTDADVYGLKKVKVTVKRDRDDGRVTELSLSQLVFDPASRGSTLDAPATTPSSSSPMPMSENTTGNQSGGNTGGANNGGANNGGGGNRGGNPGGGNPGAGKGPTQPRPPTGGVGASGGFGATGGSGAAGGFGGAGPKGKGP